MNPRKMMRTWKGLVLPAYLAMALVFSATGCTVATSLGLGASATPTPTTTSTPTFTPTATATATPTPTSTPTPTVEPLRLSMTLDPPKVKQGHTLLLEVLSNRPIAATGDFEGRPLSFSPEPGGAWAVVGVSVVAKPGAHPIQFSIADSLGATASTTVTVEVEAEDFGAEQINIPADRVGLLDPGVSADEAKRLAEVFAVVTPTQFWQGAFIRPYPGQVTSPFGMWRTYNGGQHSYHSGIDLSGPEGAPVVAANSGRVVLAAPLQVHGNTVVLDHGWGVCSAYYHLSQILVSEGQQVAQGDSVGLLGNTGLSTGAHVHWDMRVGGVPVDPVEWTERRFPK